MSSAYDEYRFRPAKRKAAAYFNDGRCTTWVQHDGSSPEPDPLLVRAIEAAREAFLAVWHSGKVAAPDSETGEDA